MVKSLARTHEFGPNCRMNCRLYIAQPLEPGQKVSLPDEQGHYLRHVIRLQAGDPITLFNGLNGEYHGYIEQLSKHESLCHIEEFVDVNREPSCHIHIIQAACRSEKIDTILQKGTELGAASFQIVRSERSSLKLEGNRLHKRLERWQKIIIEAAEQSGRTRLPCISWRDRLRDVEVTGMDAGGLALALHPQASADFGAMHKQLLNTADTSLAVGPEGGWSRRDLQTLKTMGFTGLAFGPRILRTETAAPALLAAIHAIRSIS